MREKRKGAEVDDRRDVQKVSKLEKRKGYANRLLNPKYRVANPHCLTQRTGQGLLEQYKSI